MIPNKRDTFYIDLVFHMDEDTIQTVRVIADIMNRRRLIEVTRAEDRFVDNDTKDLILHLHLKENEWEQTSDI